MELFIQNLILLIAPTGMRNVKPCHAEFILDSIKVLHSIIYQQLYNTGSRSHSRQNKNMLYAIASTLGDNELAMQGVISGHSIDLLIQEYAIQAQVSRVMCFIFNASLVYNNAIKTYIYFLWPMICLMRCC